MNSIPTIFIQTPGQSVNDQNTSISNSSVLAEIRIVLVHGSPTRVNHGTTTGTHQIPIIIQLPMQKERKRCAKRKSKQIPKRQSKQQQNSSNNHRSDIASVFAMEDVVQPSSNRNSGSEALIEFIQQHESNHRSTTTTDMISTASTSVQVPSIVAITPNINEPISDDQFWNEVQDDIDQIFSTCSQEEPNETNNGSPPLVHTDIFDDLFP